MFAPIKSESIGDKMRTKSIPKNISAFNSSLKKVEIISQMYLISRE